MFKVNTKDTRAASMTLVQCLYCSLSTYFTTFSSESMVEIENVFIYWAIITVDVDHAFPNGYKMLKNSPKREATITSQTDSAALP